MAWTDRTWAYARELATAFQELANPPMPVWYTKAVYWTDDRVDATLDWLAAFGSKVRTVFVALRVR